MTSIVSDLVVTELFDIQPDEGKINFRGNRMLLFRANVLFRLREELVRNLGVDMARNIVTRFGYRCGSFDVMAIRDYFNFENDSDWMLAGVRMHSLKGMVYATCTELKFDREAGSFLMRGTWQNSYEAENYLRMYGPAKEPICWTLTGYASGFATGFMGRDVVCVETMCQGMGDPHCMYEIRTVQDWDGKANRNIKDLQRNAILKNFQTMLEEERERVNSWQLLNQAIIDISTSLSSINMPAKAVDYAQKLLRAEKALMAVITERTKRILLYETVTPEKVNTRVLTNPCNVITSILESRHPVEIHGSPLTIHGPDVEATSLLGVPLYFKREPIGALVVVNKINCDRFSQHDREILQFLGAHSALAIGNARTYEDTNQKLQENISELYRVNSLLLSRHDELEKSTRIHNRLTSLVLEGHGLEEIGRNLSGMIARPVLIADQFFHIISHAKPEAAGTDIKKLWQEITLDGLFREKLSGLSSDKRLCTLAAGNESSTTCNLIVAPVIAGKEHLGFVATLEGCQPLSHLDCIAMEHAGTVIALDLLRQKASFETERRLKKDFLEELLEGNYENEEIIIHRAEKFGLNLTQAFRIVAFDFAHKTNNGARQCSAGSKPAGVLYQALDRAVKQVSPNITVIGKKANIIGLLTMDEAGSEVPAARLRKIAAELENRLNNTFPNYTWWAGISSPCSGISGFSVSYREACTTIDIIKTLNCRNRCHAHEMLGIYGILNINPDQFKKFINHVIGPLLEYDEKHNSRLVHTLNLYYKNNCNLQKAARDGFMNSSTMKYRLRRIYEIANINLNDPETNLQVQLALKIIEGLK